MDVHPDVRPDVHLDVRPDVRPNIRSKHSRLLVRIAAVILLII